MEDILEKEKLSKGGFYHHYKSREDVLREIIRCEMKELLDISGKEGDPLSRLLDLFRSGSQLLGAEAGVLSTLSSFTAKSIYLDELESQFEQFLKPYLSELIGQGITMGQFRKCDPAYSAEVFLAVNNHGNRKAILAGKDSEWIMSYNHRAMVVLGRHLNIEKELI